MNEEKWFSIFAVFSRVVSHKLKTPLGVMVNQLTYIEPQISKEEFLIAKDKCRDIAEITQQITPPGGKYLDRERVPVRQFVPMSEECYMICDREKTAFAFREINSVLERLAQRTRQDLQTLRAERLPSSVQFRFLLKGAPPAPFKNTSFECFTEWLMVHGDLQLLTPPLVDAIFLGQGFQISIQHRLSESEVTIEASCEN